MTIAISKVWKDVSEICIVGIIISGLKTNILYNMVNDVDGQCATKNDVKPSHNTSQNVAFVADDAKNEGKYRVYYGASTIK